MSPARTPRHPDNESYLVYMEGERERETRTWWVYRQDDDARVSPLGRIAFCGPLAGGVYVFSPAQGRRLDVFQLRDLADFCETQTADHRAARRGR